MAANDYQFYTDWYLEARRDLVYDVLFDGGDFPRWWPEVYLAARVEAAADGGRGTRIHLHTRGRLPYTLRWTAEIVACERPKGFTLQATGDFVGRGIWAFTQDGRVTHAHFDWQLRADKPLLRGFSFALKPLFRWNHRWAMARGRVRIAEELRRRQGG
jgi:hypothetical protein